VVVGVNGRRPRASSAPRACAAVGGLGLAEHEREGAAGALRPARMRCGGSGAPASIWPRGAPPPPGGREMALPAGLAGGTSERKERGEEEDGWGPQGVKWSFH
jgi:hypothetical protein